MKINNSKIGECNGHDVCACDCHSDSRVGHFINCCVGRCPNCGEYCREIKASRDSIYENFSPPDVFQEMASDTSMNVIDEVYRSW